ncbi:patr class I histocompatibility antigen, B-2 alpha chain-like isoform X2 [Ahaetulla prasina]|uniref:patr class I histocompatibility antigen, B-2 alpha chain-like isoform X2 n=1 Tax=Ahaetulla prasina TaxID=499056 RepID=UPI002647272C|nr:patr class I histocompatibility antigen, B-2 alpha chain-like isoform X2 [Ahaetulla prasina]
MDFLSFNKVTLRWVAAQPQARKVKEKWEEDPGWSHENKVYLEETCIVWLQRYLSYGKEALRKTEPPVGKVTHRVVDDSLETLICQAFGFYSKEIQATWTRDGENWEQETFRRTVAPNSDGTYYAWISIEIDPKEWDRFRCHLEHDGLQKPLVLAWKEETAISWQIPVGIVSGLISGAVILFLICRCWRQFSIGTILYQEVMTSPGDFLLKTVYVSATSDTEEDEIQSESMLQSEATSEDRTPYEWLRPQWVLEAPVLTLRKREGKEERLIKRSLSWSGDLETPDQEVSRLNQLSWPR